MSESSKTTLRSMPKELISALDTERKKSNKRNKRNRTLARFMRENPDTVVAVVRRIQNQDLFSKVSKAFSGARR